jgi:hypothetical protein
LPSGSAIQGDTLAPRHVCRVAHGLIALLAGPREDAVDILDVDAALDVAARQHREELGGHRGLRPA